MHVALLIIRICSLYKAMNFVILFLKYITSIIMYIYLLYSWIYKAPLCLHTFPLSLHILVDTKALGWLLGPVPCQSQQSKHLSLLCVFLRAVKLGHMPAPFTIWRVALCRLHSEISPLEEGWNWNHHTKQNTLKSESQIWHVFCYIQNLDFTHTHTHTYTNNIMVEMWPTIQEEGLPYMKIGEDNVCVSGKAHDIF